MTHFLKNTRHYLQGYPLSYSQIYFSNSLWLGMVLMLVSFADLGVGVSGLVTIVVCQICTVFFNFNRSYIFDGAYTFNALMVGLAMGGMYELSIHYLIVLVIASMFTFFLTVLISGKMANAGLPMLSLPFLITIWTVFLSLSNFSGIQLVSKQMFSLQVWFPHLFESVSSWFDQFAFKDVVHLYLRSLSAIFFQYNDLTGLIIAIALLFHSRMSFALTIYGFLIGYFFYHFLEGDFTPLVYSYIGFNFMLTAIALGGFFIVPSTKSHLLLLFVVPVTALLLSALHTLFTYFNLPLFSLPFNIIVVLMVGVLRMRYWSAGLQLVTLQQYSPELNHYKTAYAEKRFKGQTYFHIFLPIIGEWYVSQGHEGNITHKDGWKHAWDFDVRDEKGETFHLPGFDVKDYYCYDLPVVSPSFGWVVKVLDGVQDNLIKDVNLEQNWGNTIIIKHGEGIYSKLSHLKPYSIKVKEGDYVRSGEVIASCGSSGRSPEPHLHFQLQANPYIGSKTFQYPLAHYLVKNEDDYEFHSFDYPKESEVVRNMILNPLMANAFGFIQGKEYIWEVKENGKTRTETWNAYVDIYNKQYLYCPEMNATAYYVNDGNVFYFTDFYGNKGSLLYAFYLICQKMIMGCYKGVVIKDLLQHDVFFNPIIRALQDFIAPFYHFLEGSYETHFSEVDDYLNPELIKLGTICRGKMFGKVVKSLQGEVVIHSNGIQQITFNNKGKEITATCKA